MEKVRYMISDAAHIVAVETHVLRYWEEELALQIPRSESGRRYYTRENIEELKRIKELKEKGYRLGAIRVILHNGVTDGNDAVTALVPESEKILDQTDKLAQFTELMTEIVGKALAANNETLSKSISDDVGEHVIKEMNYLMREREEAEEERFRELNDAIRGNFKRKETGKFGWLKKDKRL